MVNFADISHHQKDIDLKIYKEAGHDRIVLKATEGKDFIDEKFKERWIQAKELKMHRVAYHFLRNEFSGKQQAEFFVREVNGAGGVNDTDILMLDTEDKITPELAKTCTVNFTEKMVDLGFNNGLTYSGKYYLDPGRITASSLPIGWRNLFISDYTDSKDSRIRVPIGWNREQIVARQFTDKAEIPGLGEDIDCSRLFKEWINVATVEEIDGLFKKWINSPMSGPDSTGEFHIQNMADLMYRVFQIITVGKENKAMKLLSDSDVNWSVENQLKLIKDKIDVLRAEVAALKNTNSVVINISKDDLANTVKEAVNTAIKGIDIDIVTDAN